MYGDKKICGKITSSLQSQQHFDIRLRKPWLKKKETKKLNSLNPLTAKIFTLQEICHYNIFLFRFFFSFYLLKP